MLMMRQNANRTARRDPSDLVGIFLPACNENQNYAPWKLFETQCCLHSKSNIFSFFHIQGLHISASTPSDFCRSTRAASTADFPFSLPRHSHSL
jgi:hypothetical protein